MANPTGLDHSPLRVMHVLRAPLGGLYRHVLDLSREQARRGHAVGLIVDAMTGGEAADRTLHQLEPSLALGLSRVTRTTRAVARAKPSASASKMYSPAASCAKR